MFAFTIILIALALYVAFVGILIIPEKEEVIIERLGKKHKTLKGGLHFIVPFVDKVAYRVTLKDQVLTVPPQEVISKDNAVLSVNAIAYIRVVDSNRAVYGIENYKHAVTTLCQTTLRSLIGSTDLDEALSNRETIKAKLKEAMEQEVSAWGVQIALVELSEIKPSETMQMAMEEQASAERKRRAVVTTAEGEKTAAITKASGELEAGRLQAETQVVLAQAELRDAVVLEAEGQLESAKKQAEAIAVIKEAMGENSQLDPATFLAVMRYTEAMENLGKSDNAKTVVMPADLVGAVKNMFGQKPSV